MMNYIIPNLQDFVLISEQRLWELVKSKKPYWKIRFCHMVDNYMTHISRSQLSEMEKIAIINHWIESDLPLELNWQFTEKLHKAYGDLIFDSVNDMGLTAFKEMLKSKISTPNQMH